LGAADGSSISRARSGVIVASRPTHGKRTRRRKDRILAFKAMGDSVLKR
jgi:hypothetical protein